VPYLRASETKFSLRGVTSSRRLPLPYKQSVIMTYTLRQLLNNNASGILYGAGKVLRSHPCNETCSELHFWQCRLSWHRVLNSCSTEHLHMSRVITVIASVAMTPPVPSTLRSLASRISISINLLVERVILWFGALRQSITWYNEPITNKCDTADVELHLVSTLRSHRQLTRQSLYTHKTGMYQNAPFQNLEC